MKTFSEQMAVAFEEAELSSSARKSLPDSEFAVVYSVRGKGGKRTKIRKYPIPDAAHGRDALSRVSASGTPTEVAKVRSKVREKFPEIGNK